VKAAASVLRRIEFHYTPCHAGWLNMAEIEISILGGSAWRAALPTQPP